ncbi:uncharacterized protein BDZ99DRAFT_204278 [Mytilinidion resinicola]|uniref:F-box domain-containing protein n=1 Tax=Mytilinidion resinicola TaxID=574789 RepID=A0A6A6Y0Y6_9PEZI|nr:uncharacterized protein BDZ99DRAFT_204278 [Mytilinidion resinicola]KAF2802476.1 hypothetical protein BDZ99DRAFT_204278 [Mytilinidion resinicola]
MESYPDRKAAALHNATQSALYVLPFELLSMVANHLSPTSKLAIRQSRRKLRYTILPELGIFPLNEFNWEISRLEGKPLSSLPKEDLALPGPLLMTYRNRPPRFRIWYSVCSTRYPAYLFSVQQRSTSASERCCLGMEHKFCFASIIALRMLNFASFLSQTTCSLVIVPIIATTSLEPNTNLLRGSGQVRLCPVRAS